MNNKTDKITITIDGPAGAGKSTISKKLAAQINFVYVDTGALYRGVAYEVKEADIDYNNKEELTGLLKNTNLDCNMGNKHFQLFSKGVDISQNIRTTEISMLASAVSALPEVRKALLSIQKNIALKHNAVFEGRDMGTIIFPFADYKFFLTADLNIRAQRRFKETNNKSEDLKKIETDMKKRDHDDSTRAESPLIPADDAIIIDSTNLNIHQVVKQIRKNIKIS